MASEQQAHLEVVAALRAGGIRFAHVPNGGQRRRGMGAREGVQAGVPDFLIFDRPPATVQTHEQLDDERWTSGGPGVGLALELKADGKRWRHVRPEQREWLWDLRERGWVIAWAPGARAALSVLLALGYRLPSIEGPAPWSVLKEWDYLGDPKTTCPFCRLWSHVVANEGLRGCRRCRRSWHAVPAALEGPAMTKSVRVENDRYFTPGWATRLLLPYLQLSPTTRFLEPAFGVGGIAREFLSAGVKPEHMVGIDVQVDAAAHDLGVPLLEHDFLAVKPLPGEFDLIVTNPPFKLALPFVQHALKCAGDRGTVAMLLRLGFASSQKRAAFHCENPSDLLVLPKRPSFTGSGTDAHDYAWFVWGPDRGRFWTVLDLDNVHAEIEREKRAAA